MLKSLGSVVAGVVAMIVVIMVTTPIAAKMLIPGGSMNATSVTRPYLVVNLFCGLAAAILGGWLAARLAGGNALGHAAAVAAIILAMGIATAFTSGTQPGQPSWYQLVVTLLGVAGALMGGWLRGR